MSNLSYSNVSSYNNPQNKTILSETPSLYPYWSLIIMGLLTGAASLATIIGNSTVLLSFFLVQAIRQPTNYLIASLAVSDLLIGIFSMPSFTTYTLLGRWPLGPLLCDLWLSLDWTVCLASQYGVLALTVDRFCSVKLPDKYRKWLNRKRASIIIGAIWIIPTLIYFPTIVGWQYFVGERTIAKGECDVSFMDNALFSLLFTIGSFWINIIAMVCLYLIMLFAVIDLRRKSKLKQKRMNSIIDSTRSKVPTYVLPDDQMKFTKVLEDPSAYTTIFRHSFFESFENRATKSIMIITLILGVFLLCWTPYKIILLAVAYCPKDSTCVNHHLYNFLYWLCYLNSSINPFCYLLANSKFREAFIRILKLDCHKY